MSADLGFCNLESGYGEFLVFLRDQMHPLLAIAVRFWRRSQFGQRLFCCFVLSMVCMLPARPNTIIETESAWEARPVKSAIFNAWSLHYAAAMGQTFTVPTDDTFLTYASFLLQTPQDPADRVSKAFVVLQPWDSATMRPVNNTLWREDILITNVPAPNFTKYEFRPNVNLLPGQMYVLYFNALGQTREDSYRNLGRFADAGNPYAGGSVVEVGIGTTDPTQVNAIYEREWRTRADTAFRLEFRSLGDGSDVTAVPEPATSALACASFLALLSLAWWRRRARMH